jgi:hypothetical protein
MFMFTWFITSYLAAFCSHFFGFENVYTEFSPVKLAPEDRIPTAELGFRYLICFVPFLNLLVIGIFLYVYSKGLKKTILLKLKTMLENIDNE